MSAMKLSIGNNPETPQLQAQFSRREIRTLMLRPGFKELRASFRPETSPVDVRSGTPQNTERYTLLAGKISSQPVATHEAQLRPFVRLLEWGSVLTSYRLNVETANVNNLITLKDITTEQFMDDQYGLQAVVRWPKVAPKKVGELVSTAMQNFGREVRYGSFGDTWDYNKQVYLEFQRLGQDSETVRNKVKFHTYPTYSIQPDPYFHATDYGNHFEIGVGHLGSHKEQLVCLVGAIAIGHADLM